MPQVKVLLFLSLISFALGGMIAALLDKRVISIEGGGTAAVLKVDPSKDRSALLNTVKKINNLSGISCDNFKRRPMAVMIAEDDEARPLSGIGLADLVIEMPIVTNSITRMMAIFICKEAKEIGSVRSARHDFIPLAKGYDAIFAHWGGSHFALDELGKKDIDNLDALPNYFDVFFRKNWIPAPHNGFTSMRRMIYAAQSLDYRLESNFSGYKFIENQNDNLVPKTLTINYIYPYNIKYEYNPSTNLYYRWRGGREEVDKITQFQVSARNIVVMRAKSRQLEGDYNDVDIIGEGDAAVYRNGEEIKGRWAKKDYEGTLRFYDKHDKEISFAAGPIWIEVAELGTIVNYESEQLNP